MNQSDYLHNIIERCDAFLKWTSQLGNLDEDKQIEIDKVIRQVNKTKNIALSLLPEISLKESVEFLQSAESFNKINMHANDDTKPGMHFLTHLNLDIAAYQHFLSLPTVNVAIQSQETRIELKVEEPVKSRVSTVASSITRTHLNELATDLKNSLNDYLLSRYSFLKRSPSKNLKSIDAERTAISRLIRSIDAIVNDAHKDTEEAYGQLLTTIDKTKQEIKGVTQTKPSGLNDILSNAEQKLTLEVESFKHNPRS